MWIQDRLGVYSREEVSDLSGDYPKTFTDFREGCWTKVEIAIAIVATPDSLARTSNHWAIEKKGAHSLSRKCQPATDW